MPIVCLAPHIVKEKIAIFSPATEVFFIRYLHLVNLGLFKKNKSFNYKMSPKDQVGQPLWARLSVPTFSEYI